LKIEYPAETLETNDEYQQLQRRLDELEPTGKELADADPEALEGVPVGDSQ